jgi:diguanylate cyclase (GGDEF)-like protein
MHEIDYSQIMDSNPLLYKSEGFILIVDDNPTNLSVLSQVLKSEGYKTRFAISGEGAIEQINEELPNMILLDIQMPGMDGFETCVALKSQPNTKDIPVIFITASVDVDSKVKGLSLGAVDYITKPFQHEEVIARVNVHLQNRYLTQKIQKQAIELLHVNQQLQRLANLDGLTEVANRRKFDEYLKHEWLRLSREKQYLSILLTDIDHFKDYNDNYGHQAGDLCLKKVADILQKSIRRSSDLVARYGGEEFAIILPNTPLDGAITIASEIHKSLESQQIIHECSPVSSILTISLGITTLIPTSKLTCADLISFTDKALYRAKRSGRNRYCIHEG